MGLEQPAPAPPGLCWSKICAETERGAQVNPETLATDTIEVIARPHHPFETLRAILTACGPMALPPRPPARPRTPS
jgi:hypothetical protein